MSVRFIDSFAHYDSALAYRKWNLNSPITMVGSGGRRNAPYMEIGAGGVGIFRTLTPTSTWILGAAFYLDNVIGAVSNLFILGNGGIYNAGLTLNADNTLSLYMGNNYEAYRIATSTQALQITGWNFIEGMFIFSGGTSTLTLTGTVRVNGETFFTGTGTGQGVQGNQLLFAGNYMNTVGFGGPGNNSYFAVQDFYALDTSGTDINGFSTTNTTFLGDVEVDAFFPATNVAVSWGTVGGDGTHAYSCVNATSPTDDTNYVYTSNTGTIESFEYQSISTFSGTIFGAQYLTCCKKDAEGFRTLEMTLNGSGVALSNFAITTGSNTSTTGYLSDYYVYYVAPLDSCNGTAWTTSVYDTATFGIEVTG